MAEQVDSESWWSKARSGAAKRCIDGGRSKTARDCKDVHESKRWCLPPGDSTAIVSTLSRPPYACPPSLACTVILHLQSTGLAGLESAAMPGRHSVLWPCATSDRLNGWHALGPDMCCTLIAG